MERRQEKLRKEEESAQLQALQEFSSLIQGDEQKEGRVLSEHLNYVYPESNE